MSRNVDEPGEGQARSAAVGGAKVNDDSGLSRRTLLKGLGVGAGAVAVTAIARPAEARAERHASDQALGLLYDGTLCIGCRACIPACKEANGMPPELANGDLWDAPLDISGKTLNIIKAYREGSGIHKDQVKDGFAFTKLSCMHCIDPSCVSACPVSAMNKDPVTGIVKYDADICIGCRYCVAACPFNVPRFTYDTPIPKISKCQLCAHRMGDGHYAACAEVCPTGATLFGPLSELKKEVARRRSLAPGSKTVFPRGKIGGTDTYTGEVGHYVPHTYGETEIGGTQVLHLSGVPFDLLGKPDVGDVSPASTSEGLQHAIYRHLIAPLSFLGALGIVAYRHMRPDPDGPKEEGET